MAGISRGGVDLEAQIPVATAVNSQYMTGADQDAAAFAAAEQAAAMQSLDKMERSIRHGFARKVLALLFIQICILVGVICIFLYVPTVNAYCATSSSTWLTVVSGFLFLFGIISLSCTRELNKRYPINVICLFALTGLSGVFVGSLVSQINPDYIWIAFAATSGIMVTLGLFACQTRYDFTGIGPYLSVGIIFLLIFGLFAGFRPTFYGDWSNGARGVIYLGIGLLIFSLYVVYDMQLVLGGKHRLRFSVDDYVVAAISLYTDFLMIFFLIIGAMGGQQ